jgi:hypothetical protein
MTMETPDYIAREALERPMDWEGGSTIHNWRNYVGYRTKALWDGLADHVKVAIARDADDMACRHYNRGDWD